MNAKILRQAVLLGLLVTALACGSAAYQRGRIHLEHGRLDEAVASLEKAVAQNPGNVKYKTELVRARLLASQRHQENARLASAREDYATALKELQTALRYDPGNQLAQDDMAKILAAIQVKEREQRSTALTLEAMKAEAAQKSGAPQLDPASNIPIVLKFSDTPLRTILDAVSKASGINFLYDDKAETTKRVTVDFSKVSLEKVLNYLMLQTKHFYKVLDPHTLIIVPDTKQKRDEYQDQVIKTFYLSNADVKDVFQLVRSILQARKMAMNQDLNSITIQDTPENVAMAQRIIENNDKSKGEVLVDVELLEVNSSLVRNLGMDLSAKTFTIGPESNLTKDKDSGKVTGIGTGPPVRFNSLDSVLRGTMWVSPVPNLIVNLLLTDTDSQVLAKPQLRVMEGQKASVHIGDRIPIATSNQYLGSTGTTTTYTPITSYTYQDVGVKIEIEPKVHHNREVTIKLKTEVSSVTGYVSSGSSLTGDQPIIGTRESTTTLRLEDGETSLLAGLIRKEDKKSISGLPGVSEVPILRRLFSNTKDEKASTDVVMLVTPHIIRMPNITEENLEPLWVGTEQGPKVGGSAPSPFAPAPASAAAPAPAPAVAAEEKPAEKPAEEKAPEEKPAEEKPPAQAGRILISPTSLQARPGEPAILNLVLVGAQEMKTLHLEMNYPNAILKFEGAEQGTFFSMGGAPATFNAQEVSPGALVLDLARGDASGASGSGLIARLRFTAANGGEGRINLASAVSNSVSGQSSPLPPAFATVVVKPGPSGGEGAE
ncbi:MAG: tetratricopeptide repeat protein [Acidobacteriota bacterium]